MKQKPFIVVLLAVASTTFAWPQGSIWSLSLDGTSTNIPLTPDPNSSMGKAAERERRLNQCKTVLEAVQKWAEQCLVIDDDGDVVNPTSSSLFLDGRYHKGASGPYCLHEAGSYAQGGNIPGEMAEDHAITCALIAAGAITDPEELMVSMDEFAQRGGLDDLFRVMRDIPNYQLPNKEQRKAMGSYKTFCRLAKDVLKDAPWTREAKIAAEILAMYWLGMKLPVK